MAGENSRNGRSPLLPWAQFAWTVGIAIVGGIISGTGAYYSLKDQMEAQMSGQLAQMRQQITQERARELQNYLPLGTYWQFREETKESLNQIQRQLDRIELRIK